MKLYNTETRQKTVIQSTSGRRIAMYTCGPTIYDYAHIGNFRSYIAEDLLRRTLQFFDFQVEQAMNVTDVDDKTIRGAIAKKVSLREFTKPYGEAFFEDLKKLHIQTVEHYPFATDYIPQMIQMIEVLIEKGFAYVAPDLSVYYKIAHFPSYGRLSHLCLNELQGNANGDHSADEYDKEHIADFALWKAHDPERDGAIFWESPFGKGRPGWHIECSAMARSILGETIDLHCGGVDNMFPHHENEIAQSEGCSGHLFVKHWFHVEHLLVDHKKMSKSLGNFYTLRDLLSRGYTGTEVRYLLLSTHYRTQLNFTMGGLDAARSSLQRVRDLVLRLFSLQTEETSFPIESLLDKSASSFKEALGDDLNISAALAVLFDLIREINTLIDQKLLGKKEAATILQLLNDWDQVLAVFPLAQEEEIPEAMLALLQQRERARLAKDFCLSDSLRKEILSKGYLIEDTPTGPRLKKK
jgi:cysteinyl-tRNA synthetase